MIRKLLAWRIGFTLIELLVVIAIIGVLIALPQTISGWGDLPDSTAHGWRYGPSYNSQNIPLPVKSQSAGTFFQILPYIEQDNLWKTPDWNGVNANFAPPDSRWHPSPANFDSPQYPDPRWKDSDWFQDPGVPPWGPVDQAQVKIYACPSRRAAAATGQWAGDPFDKNFPKGFTDYAVVRSVPVPIARSSNGIYYNPSLDPRLQNQGAVANDGFSCATRINEYTGDARHNILGPTTARNTFASVKDGTSNTMMIAEKFVQPQDYGDNGWTDGDGYMIESEQDNVRNTGYWNDPAMIQAGGGVPIWTSALANPSRDQDVNGPPWDTWGNYGASADASKWCGNMRGFGIFGSAHPAGINAVFGDGSVHNIKYGIDPDVFNALGRSDDGTNLHADFDNIQ